MAIRTHALIWRGLDEWQVEAASVELDADGLVATGTQIGSDPVAYRLDYRLDARGDFITRALEIVVTGQDWSRHLDLRHDGSGTWSCDAGAVGAVGMPQPGCNPALLAGALDCDLGRSPLTNMMPIRRAGLDRRDDAEDFLMAWVSVPDLRVVSSPQRYEHVRTGDGGSVVRFVDRGEFEGFTAELALDRDGFVIHYPELAERVRNEPREP